ncbi:probable low-specificity L-threonine aldolase 2 isoform X2 [Phacochoerus africanus]|uniref:probable low-specificity L-threonine aldolase 2 isoform X2 n=1 Tax=Phacochoerus africanus TaxID=41426 RepID=UPI001FD9BD29|nr:probable low-specificity L-threonine aldolase 2 isoform X2 [Phacochoerus africanus]
MAMGPAVMALIMHPADTHCRLEPQRCWAHCSAGSLLHRQLPPWDEGGAGSCRPRLRSCSGWSGPCLCPQTPWPTSSLIAGVHSHPLPDLPHGTLDLAELERLITRGLGSPYHPVCELICLENTHSSSGGRVLPIEYLHQVHLLARTYGVRVHLDGARLMNAAVALRVPPACIVQHCDSVSLCFSKGLGAPVGALVGGPKHFIEEAWRLRKALGGGMRQAGVLAAAALVGLADAEEVLLRDHQNAQKFAKGLQELASPVCSVDLSAVETNVVMVRVDGLPPEELCQRLQAVSADEVAQTGRAVRVLLFPWTEQSVRAVWHRDVSAQDTELALGKWAFVLRALRTG